MTLATATQAYYKFDENSGTAPADATGNGHTGTTHGSSIWTGSGKINAGLSLDGSTNYVSTTYSGITGTSDRGIWFWMKASSNSSTYSWFSYGDTGSTGTKVLINTESNTLFVRTQGANCQFTGTVCDGNWHLVLINFDHTQSGTLAGISAYVDNVASTRTINSDGSWSTGTDSNMTWGCDAPGGNINFAKGNLDEGGIANIIIGSTDRSTIYNSGTGAQYPWSTAYTRSISDVLTLSDSMTRAVVSARAIANTLAMSDSDARQAALARPISDLLSESDVATRTDALHRSITDASTTADALTIAKTTIRLLNEATTTGDSGARTVASQRMVTDGASVADGLTDRLAATRNVSDGFATMDAIADIHAIIRSVADSMTTGDNMAVALALHERIAESMATSDAVMVAWQRVVVALKAVYLDVAPATAVAVDVPVAVVSYADIATVGVEYTELPQ